MVIHGKNHCRVFLVGADPIDLWADGFDLCDTVEPAYYRFWNTNPDTRNSGEKYTVGFFLLTTFLGLLYVDPEEDPQ